MVALETPGAKIGSLATDFNLLGVDNNRYSLRDVKKPKGLLVMFICNHCPYVQKQIDRMIETTKTLNQLDIGVVAINANDASQYPEDSFENMQRYAEQERFNFPYLYDETQEVAKAYGAVCTPDFFGFNADMELQYRGRLDGSWSGLDGDAKRELFEAMEEIAREGKTSKPQNPSVGCSIKWRLEPSPAARQQA